jgi:O-antigen/teichoic acid export membrane protein
MTRVTEAKSPRLGSLGVSSRVLFKAIGRLGWGVADQGMSSLSNFAVNLYIARTLGALDYGAFSLAYVTYGFALNASRGLSTDPLLVRFSGVEPKVWKRAVGACTGTAIVVGLAAGICVLGVGTVIGGSTGIAFVALGLTMPALMLQDSWRYSFFAAGRGFHAFLNDTVWTVVLLPALVVLAKTGHATTFWFVTAWGASAGVAALIGPIQARVRPMPSIGYGWIVRHKDLGLRYLAEGTTNSAAVQLRNYGIGGLLGLAAVGYVQAANTLMGPFMVIFFGMGLVTLPEAARVLRNSPRRLPLFCIAVSGGLTLLGLAWGAVLLVGLPRGLGQLMLGGIWHSTYPLVLPSTFLVLGGCVSTGAGSGLHALGAAKRSLRAMVFSSALIVVCGLAGAFLYGAPGTMWGTALASWIGAVMFWWQLRTALHEAALRRRAATGRHRGAVPQRARSGTSPAPDSP